jgi:protein O-GlcNAc transferase
MPDTDGLLALYGQGRFAEVADHAAARVERDPADGLGWKILGTACQQIGRLAQAQAALEKSVALLPDDFEAHNNLAALLRDQGVFEAAEIYARRAVALAPGASSVRLNLGLILSGQGNFVEAASHLVLAPAGDPMGRFALGTALRKLGRLDDAAAAFAAATAINPNFAAAQLALGSCLLALGQTADAVERLRLAVSLAPGSSDALGTLGLALLEQGSVREGLMRLEAGYGVVRFERNRGVTIHSGATP